MTGETPAGRSRALVVAVGLPLGLLAVFTWHHLGDDKRFADRQPPSERAAMPDTRARGPTEAWLDVPEEPQPDEPAPPADEDETTGAELLASLLEKDIPPMAGLRFLSDLDQGREEARQHRCPVLHILVRGRDDPDWLDLQERLDASKLSRAILATCVLVISARPDLPASPTIAVHSTEIVTPGQGRYVARDDGSLVFVVRDQPNAGGFELPAAPFQKSPIPGAIGAVRSPDGSPLLRHRIVEIFSGVPDVQDLGQRLWRVIRQDYRIDRLRLDLREGWSMDPALRQLLSDELGSLLSPDERIHATMLFMRQRPQDLWAVHRVCQIMFGDGVADPGPLLLQARKAWPDPESAQRLLVESQVELTLYGNREKALDLLENAAGIAPQSPEIWERLARCALVGAREAEDHAAALELRRMAVLATSELRRLDSTFSGLRVLEQSLDALLAEATDERDR